MNKGLFITLEGPDGSGKTTQLENIASYFRDRGAEVICSREPGGTKISEKLREIVLDKEYSEMADSTEMMIYAAARAQHVAELIKPALMEGKIVVCDRFVDSSMAYQGYGRGLGDVVRKVNKYATEGLEPDLTFFMDIDPIKAKTRIESGTEDRLESEKAEFMYKLYDGYIEMCEKEPNRIVRIDADRDVETVKQEILKYTEKLAEKRGI